MLALIMSIKNDEDRDFVSSLYAQYADKMQFIAYDVLKNVQDAQDCVHDTVRVIIDKVERFKENPDEDYLKWLISLACRNRAIDRYRVKQKHNDVQSMTQYDVYDDEKLMDLPDLRYNAEELLNDSDNYKNLIKLVNRLDNKYRDVILLKYRGWENKDIADFLLISIDAVRQRLHRGKMLIAEMGRREYHWDI